MSARVKLNVWKIDASVEKKLKCADMRNCIDFDNDYMQEQLDKEDKLILDDWH